MSSLKGRSRPQIIIDNDAGGDDAMAIFLALLYEKHFEGIIMFQPKVDRLNNWQWEHKFGKCLQKQSKNT
uniref:Uncharacterized protein n=1 Tax=Papilio polytes TaxID=76194 RepID=I4DRH4_PAPPL|nr:unknown unsecreted protein [Papilio polytes]